MSRRPESKREKDFRLRVVRKIPRFPNNWETLQGLEAMPLSSVSPATYLGSTLASLRSPRLAEIGPKTVSDKTVSEKTVSEKTVTTPRLPGHPRQGGASKRTGLITGHGVIT